MAPTATPSVPFTLSEILEELRGSLEQYRIEVRDASQWAREEAPEAIRAEYEAAARGFQARVHATLRCLEHLHSAESALAAQLVSAWQQDTDEAVREIGEYLADGSGLGF